MSDSTERRWWIAEGSVLLGWLAVAAGGGLLATRMIGGPLMLAPFCGVVVALLLNRLMAFPANQLLDYCKRRGRG